MPTPSSIREYYRQSLKEDLARCIGVSADELPTEASLEAAGKFFKIKNSQTFYTWKHENRHPLVWVSVGGRLHIACASMIDLRLSQMTIPGEAA